MTIVATIVVPFVAIGLATVVRIVAADRVRSPGADVRRWSRDHSDPRPSESARRVGSRSCRRFDAVRVATPRDRRTRRRRTPPAPVRLHRSDRGVFHHSAHRDARAGDRHSNRGVAGPGDREPDAARHRSTNPRRRRRPRRANRCHAGHCHANFRRDPSTLRPVAALRAVGAGPIPNSTRETGAAVRRWAVRSSAGESASRRRNSRAPATVRRRRTSVRRNRHRPGRSHPGRCRHHPCGATCRRSLELPPVQTSRSSCSFLFTACSMCSMWS